MSSSFTVDDLHAIERSIASGELRVAFNGRDVTYRSMNDLIRAKNEIRANLEAAGLLTKSTRRFSYVARRMD